jgi:hypothetical protein
LTRSGTPINSAHDVASSNYNKVVLAKALAKYFDSSLVSSFIGTLGSASGSSLITSVLPVNTIYTIKWSDNTTYSFLFTKFTVDLSTGTMSIVLEAVKNSGEDTGLVIPEGWAGVNLVLSAEATARFVTNAQNSGVNLVWEGESSGSYTTEWRCNSDGKKCTIYFKHQP